MISTLTSSFSGFFFWMIVARFYPVYEVGLAAALISTIFLISVLSLMGFDVSLIKYIPEVEDKENLINTCLCTTLLVSLILTSIFIAGLDLWSPYLLILRENLQLLSLFVGFSLILPLQLLQSQGIFVGFRETKYSFYQAIITLLRMAIVPFLVVYGSIGILAPYGLTPLISFFAGLYFTNKIYPYVPKFKIDKNILQAILHFSGGNYVSRVLETLPSFILPILVINKLGAEINAYFYIAWQISMLVLIFSKSISNSLFAEIVSNKDDKRYLVIKSLKFMSILLLIFIGGTFLFGKYLLMLFGNEYVVNSYPLLCTLVLASVPFSFNTIYVGIMRSKGEYSSAIFVYGVSAFLTLTGSYILIENYSLFGVAYSWLFANMMASLGIMLMLINKSISKKMCRILE